jgi:hypothetical protein
MQIECTNDFYRHTYPHGITSHKHIGTDRQSEVKSLLDKDIVFTTFATAMEDTKRGQSSIFNIHWFRIVLDEGTKTLPVFSISIDIILCSPQDSKSHHPAVQDSPKAFGATPLVSYRHADSKQTRRPRQHRCFSKSPRSRAGADISYLHYCAHLTRKRETVPEPSDTPRNHLPQAN